jgi:hypothetical protein
MIPPMFQARQRGEPGGKMPGIGIRAFIFMVLFGLDLLNCFLHQILTLGR